MQISVIVTCYNAHATLAAALTSVAVQSYPPSEIIIVDDGSTDDSVAIARSVMPAATIIEQANQGVSAARNKGLAHVNGDVIAFLDDDDVWHPTKLERQIRLLELHPHLDLIATRWSRTSPVPRQDLSIRWLSYRDLTLMNQFQTSTVLMRSQLAAEVGGFDSTLDTVEDWAFWIACAKKGTLAVLEQDLVLYRDSPDGVSKDLHRFWTTLERMIHTTDAMALLDASDRERIIAWHVQRMFVAALLQRDLSLLTKITFRGLRVSPIAQLHATRTLTIPFLTERLRRRREI
ncbi:glycosyltransferase family A protein [Ferrimicrobium sp.]|uniref:glycosyltransferase family 2 protein n=1 Tax=Ferrimicrobium sp. TaxID=2926050 RepID=UPI0026322F17|nr:glycosyltransferase family A protein [Ferrimicrobium sp.]